MKNISTPNSLPIEDDPNVKQIEMERGLESLRRAWEDHILSDEEYTKMKYDLMNKYS